jgi:hypothetical protein
MHASMKDEKTIPDNHLTLDTIYQGETKAIRRGKSLLSRLGSIVKSV